MGDENNSGFSLEDILKEQREKRETANEKQPTRPQGARPRQGTNPPQTQKPQSESGSRQASSGTQQIPRAQAAPAAGQQPPARKASAQSAGREAPMEDINAYATGSIPIPSENEPAPKGKKEKKKKKGGLFGRKKKVPDYVDSDDLYYGVQLKPIDEYRKGYNAPTGEFSADEAYADLFDNSKKAIDDEVEQNFLRLQKERRSRVAEAVKSAGIDRDEIQQELGIIAPMPVTSFAADPYTKQHGIEAGGKQNPEMTRFQKAQLDSMKNNQQTMEIKLNVESSTMELKKVRDIHMEQDNNDVSDETVRRILKAAPPVQEQDNRQPASTAAVQAVSEAPEASQAAAETAVPPPESAVKQETDTVIEGREMQTIPHISSVYEYRSRGIPAHVINADVLQSALLTEANQLAAQKSSRKGKRPAKPAKLQEQERWQDIGSNTQELPEMYVREDLPESIDDYTGPEDASSISSELKSDMRDVSLRMMITGACTVVLTLLNLIFGGTFKNTASDLGSAPVIYIILTLIFLGASIAACYRTIGNGLKALMTFNANSDSGVAAAAVGAVVQTVAALFFTQGIVDGSQHLYAAVLTAVLFVNTIGKLTMLRRIHSNFRFITSREQKYAVNMYDDHNTALQMTRDVVAEQPLVAYQCKTGFLKRFLELSYQPDPAETSSQMIAPIGLISSLLLCVVSMLVTKSVPSAIGALSAALIASVAVTNMLAVNLPMSRLAKVARRAGAMLVGYEAVYEFGDTNAIMVDAGDLFPAGTVVLNGIKTYGPRGQIEEAILAASALVSKVGGPLEGVFAQVIDENGEGLPQVEKAVYEDEQGIRGHVEGKRIFIGNRDLLLQHKIEPPARSDETEYAAANRQIFYIAVDSHVAAMLVVTYAADRRRKNELQRMEDSGISLVVRSTDSNVTSQLISRLFGIDANYVRILPGNLAEEYRQLVQAETPRSDAVLATKGRIESMISVVSACIRNKRGVSLIVALQTAAAVLGFILVAFLACFGAIGRLSAFGLFLFELMWLLLIILIPKLRK